MKKIIFALLCFCLCLFSNAQTTGTGHCGNPSGPEVCTPVDTFSQPGLYPVSSGFSPLTIGVSTSATINFKNYDTVNAPGFGALTITAIVIDSINNLPDGLCWASNVAGDSFLNEQDGCLVLSGTPTAAPGQYRLNIAITAYIEGLGNTGVPYNANALGLYYYVRVICPGDTTPHPIDTVGQAENTNLFIPYTACAPVICTNAGGTVLAEEPSVCSGQTSTLWVYDDTGTIQWQQSTDGVTWTNVTTGTGADSDYYTTGPLSTSLYYWTAVSQPGCPDTVFSNSILVTVSPLPDATIMALDTTTFCQGDSVGLTVQENTAYSWSTGSTAENIYAHSTNTYSVTVTNPYECTASSSIAVTVIPTAVAGNITLTNAGDTIVCAGQTATFWATGYTGNVQWQYSVDDYTWYNVTTGTGADSDYYTTAPLSSSLYYWTAVSQPGCPDTVFSNSILVTVSPLPDATIMALDTTTFCQGDSVGLTVQENTAYSWSTGSTAENIYAHSTNTYSVTVTNPYECTASSSIAVTVIPTAVAGNITITNPTDSMICSGQTATFWATGYTGSIQWQQSVDDYTWYNVTTGTGADSDYYTTAPLSSSLYYWTAVSQPGCPGVVYSNAILVTVNPFPAVPVITENSSNDTLIASSQGVTYQWFMDTVMLSGDTNMELAITQDGIYSVVVDSNGCTNQSVPDNIMDVAINSPAALAGIKLYPNPNNGTFILEFTEDVLRNIEIYDALGNVIYSSAGISKTSQINMQNAEAGVYLLCIKQNQQITNVKFVVMK